MEDDIGYLMHKIDGIYRDLITTEPNAKIPTGLLHIIRDIIRDAGMVLHRIDRSGLRRLETYYHILNSSLTIGQTSEIISDIRNILLDAVRRYDEKRLESFFSELFRGSVEKEIDAILKPVSIDRIVAYFKDFPLKTVEDFCFGVIVRFFLTELVAKARDVYRRNPSDKEIDEALNIIERRAMEIKGKIKLAMSK